MAFTRREKFYRIGDFVRCVANFCVSRLNLRVVVRHRCDQRQNPNHHHNNDQFDDSKTKIAPLHVTTIAKSVSEIKLQLSDIKYFVVIVM